MPDQGEKDLSACDRDTAMAAVVIARDFLGRFPTFHRSIRVGEGLRQINGPRTDSVAQRTAPLRPVIGKGRGGGEEKEDGKGSHGRQDCAASASKARVGFAGGLMPLERIVQSLSLPPNP